MQFIPLDNFKAVFRALAYKATDKNFVDTSGTSHSLTTSTDYTRPPFYYSSTGTQTATSNSYPFFFAVSNETISHDTYQITPIGTTSQVATPSADGYNIVITITGSESTTIRHLVAVRKLHWSNSNSADAVLFALKLDTPVELNASNNYTANFTFAIEF